MLLKNKPALLPFINLFKYHNVIHCSGKGYL